MSIANYLIFSIVKILEIMNSMHTTFKWEGKISNKLKTVVHCTEGYSDHVILKKITGVHGFIGVEHYLKTLL